MKYKHVVRIGIVLLATFALIVTSMYYFNQDKCPESTFSCANSTLCVSQNSFCNNELDCPEGEDEDILTCLDATGVSMESWNYYIKLYNKNKMNASMISCPNITEEYYDSCSYNNNSCAVVCSDFPYRVIPQKFAKTLKKLTIIDSSLPVLKIDSFRRYSELEELYLNNNGILLLERHIFFYQKSLTNLNLVGNNIQEIKGGHLIGLTSLVTLNLAENKIFSLDLKDLENSTSLYLLDVSKNLLTTKNIYLPFLPALRELILDQNHLDSITDDLFAQLPGLTSMCVGNLDHNLIQNISPDALENLHNLVDLTLMGNKITELPSDLFEPTPNLSILAIGYNRGIKYLPSTTFEPIKASLRSLGVEEIDIDNIDKKVFNMFTNLETIYFKKFHYCTTYTPHVKICHPASDGVSSLSHLLRTTLIKVAVWGISSVTSLGNTLVLWGRFSTKDENRVLSIIIKNLAVSDSFMGIYLLIIGIQDIRFRNSYGQEARVWMSSWSCTLIGMLAMTSSEVSVLILSFMSVERFMLIAAPFRGRRAITPQTAASAMLVIWVIGISVAILPAILWRSSTRFYGLNGMCFPLHIDDPFGVGWEYSAIIFLGVNFIGLLVIVYAYAGMFASILKTRHATPLPVDESEFALRFFLIVLTDVICWAPIILLKIMALAEYPVPPDLHAWVVVFILPVNSAVNPLLYTFTTPKFRDRLTEGWLGKVRNIASIRGSRSESQTSCSYTTRNGMSVLSSSKKILADERTSKRSFNETLLIDFNTKNE